MYEFHVTIPKINVFVNLRNDNITFIDIAIISLAINKTGRFVLYPSIPWLVCNHARSTM